MHISTTTNMKRWEKKANRISFRQIGWDGQNINVWRVDKDTVNSYVLEPIYAIVSRVHNLYILSALADKVDKGIYEQNWYVSGGDG